MPANPIPRNYTPGTAGQVVSAVQLVYDPNVVLGNGTTGALRPFNTTTDVGGAVSVSGLSVQVGAVAITGNPTVTISNAILAVSGTLAGGSAGGGGGLITGGGGYLGITGTVAVSNLNEIAALSSGNAFLASISGSLSTNLTSPVNVTGSISLVGNTATTLVGTSGNAGTILGTNTNRHAWYLQNVGTGIMLVNFSASIPSTGQFNILLQGGTVNFDGNGQSWSDQFGNYKGPVSVTGSVGSPILYTVWDL